MDFDKNLESIVTKEKLFISVYNPGPPIKLGTGTFGSVWKIVIENEEVATNVAVKVATFGTERDADGIDGSLLREAGILSRVNHPNVIKLLDVALSVKQMAIVLPIAKKSLHDYLHKDYPSLPRDKIVENAKLFTLQMARGIAYLHSLNILHGDYKPPNILLYEEENCPSRVVITDFGLASTASCYEVTPFNEIFSLWYRSPEILLGAKYTFIADTWALGCIVAELLTHKAIFQGDGENDMLFLIFNRLGLPDEQSWPGVTNLPRWSLKHLGKIQAEKVRNNVKEDFSPASTKDVKYAYYADSTRTALDKSEQDFLNALLVLDPKKRLSMQDVLNNVWLQESSASLVCYSSPPTQEQTCSTILMNRLPPLRKPPLTEIDATVYTYFYHRTVIKHHYSDKTVAVMVDLTNRYLEEKPTDNPYGLFSACLILATMLTGSTSLSPEYLESKGYITTKSLATLEQQIVKTIGSDLFTTTCYDLVKEYAQQYTSIVFDVSRSILLFSYYTTVTINTPIELVALVCIMFACSASNTSFNHQLAIGKYRQRQIEETVSTFASSLATVLDSVEPHQVEEFFIHTERSSIDSRSILRNIPPMRDAINPKHLREQSSQEDLQKVFNGLAKLTLG